MKENETKRQLYTYQETEPDRVEEHVAAYEVRTNVYKASPFEVRWSPETDILDRVEELKKGLPADVVNELCMDLLITRQEVARYTGIPVRTLNRKMKEGRLTCGQSERIVRLNRILEKTEAVLGAQKKAVQWLKTPRSHFRGKTPLEMVETELGTEEVFHLLGRIEYGVFT